jgi:DNA repair exonuclease SbcCD ATPase subunit
MALSIEWECKGNGCREKSPHMWYCSRACSYKDNKYKRCEHWGCDQYVDIDARVQLKYCNTHVEGNLKTVTGYLMATRTTRSKEAEAYHYTIKSYKMELDDVKIEIENERKKNERLKDTNERLEAKNERLKDTNKMLEAKNERLKDTNKRLEAKNADLEIKFGAKRRELPIIKRHKGKTTPYASYYGAYGIHPPPPPNFTELEKFLKKVGGGKPL